MSYSDTLREKRDAALAAADDIVAKATADARDLTADEDKAIADALDIVRDLDEQVRRHVELEQRAAAAAEARKENKVEEAITSVKSEPRTYTSRSEHSFIRDAFAAQLTTTSVRRIVLRATCAKSRSSVVT